MTKAKARARAKAKAKTKEIRMPGKERPAASRLVIQRPPTTEPHLRNTGRSKKPSDSQPIGPTAEGLDYRFLRSQPRVIGPGSFRKARPRRSEYNTNTQSKGHNINPPLPALQSYSSAR